MPQPATPPPIDVETGPHPTASVIWMHGFGADGHDFEPIVPQLVRPGERALRFVFPTAPIRPITLNGGAEARAWYDLESLDRRAIQDEAGVRGSAATIEALIRRENERGVPGSRIALAGFSQGGAMALFTGLRHADGLAGIVALSCYMLLAWTFDAERQPANRSTPVFLAHGTDDPVVPLQIGEETLARLRGAGYPVDWHRYTMGHAVIPEEIATIAEFLRRTLA